MDGNIFEDSHCGCLETPISRKFPRDPGHFRDFCRDVETVPQGLAGLLEASRTAQGRGQGNPRRTTAPPSRVSSAAFGFDQEMSSLPGDSLWS